MYWALFFLCNRSEYEEVELSISSSSFIAVVIIISCCISSYNGHDSICISSDIRLNAFILGSSAFLDMIFLKIIGLEADPSATFVVDPCGGGIFVCVCLGGSMS